MICFITLLLLVAREMVAIWQVHTGEPQLIKQVFVHLLDTLFHCVAYQEKMKGNRPVRIETPVPKAVSLWFNGLVTTEVFCFNHFR